MKTKTVLAFRIRTAFRAVAERKLAILDSAAQLRDVGIPPANLLEALKGDRKGQHSIRIDDQFRICFVWTPNAPRMSKSSTTTDGPLAYQRSSRKAPTMRNGMRPIHPGEVLREEFLLPLNLSASQLARNLKVPPNRVTALIKEERAVSAETAMRLALAFDTTPAFWINLQATFDLRSAEVASAKTIAKEVTPVSRPISLDPNDYPYANDNAYSHGVFSSSHATRQVVP